MNQHILILVNCFLFNMNYSVIIPAYNASKTIKECIKAIIPQLTNGDELIIIDDGSTDNTKEIVKSFKVIKYIKINNSGPAIARNTGAKIAKNDIIIFIDSDCIAQKDWLKEMILPFKKKKILGVQGAYKTNQESIIARFEQIDIEYRYIGLKTASNKGMLDWIGSYSAAFKRREFLKLGGFDENFPIASGEDPEFSFRLAKIGKLIFNEKAIVYHTHPATLKKYLRTKFFRAYFRPRMYSKNKNKIIKDSYTPQSLKAQIIFSNIIIITLILFLIFQSQITLMLFLLSIILFILSLSKFMFFAIRKNLVIGLAGIGIIFIRSLVFSVGLVWGKLNDK